MAPLARRGTRGRLLATGQCGDWPLSSEGDRVAPITSASRSREREHPRPASDIVGGPYRAAASARGVQHSRAVLTRRGLRTPRLGCSSECTQNVPDHRELAHRAGVRRFPPHPISLASDRPLVARSETRDAELARWNRGSMSMMVYIWIDSYRPSDPRIRRCSHPIFHPILRARQSGTVRHRQRLKPLVASLLGTVRNGQKRL
jgi:hypothetical protein